MRILARPIINEFGSKHLLAINPLNSWWEKIRQAKCENFNDLKNVFNSVDYIQDHRYVFNIGGNNYRLVAMIHFKSQALYIRAILTHSEYDEHNKNGTLISL